MAMPGRPRLPPLLRLLRDVHQVEQATWGPPFNQRSATSCSLRKRQLRKFNLWSRLSLRLSGTSRSRARRGSATLRPSPSRSKLLLLLLLLASALVLVLVERPWRDSTLAPNRLPTQIEPQMADHCLEEDNRGPHPEEEHSGAQHRLANSPEQLSRTTSRKIKRTFGLPSKILAVIRPLRKTKSARLSSMTLLARTTRNGRTGTTSWTSEHWVGTMSLCLSSCPPTTAFPTQTSRTTMPFSLTAFTTEGRPNRHTLA
mmetsp:Transcript_68211/g.142549  ORF Transcript_68211/g.142549 Transcript_68211/m.142549 type:complete len:257 (+) Transcript_68211:289-1059(+)